MLDCTVGVDSNHSDVKRKFEGQNIGGKNYNLVKGDLSFFLKCAPGSPVKISIWRSETFCIMISGAEIIYFTVIIMTAMAAPSAVIFHFLSNRYVPTQFLKITFQP